MTSVVVGSEKRWGRKRKRIDVNNVVVGSDGKKKVVETKLLKFVGRYVRKEFEGSGILLGKVTSYDLGLYRVNYEDGDFEDLECSELEVFLIDDSDMDIEWSERKGKLDKLVSSEEISGKVPKAEKNLVQENMIESNLSTDDACDNEAIKVCAEGQNDVDSDSLMSDSVDESQELVSSGSIEAATVPHPELPASSGNIGVPEAYISHLFSVYSFLRSFSSTLFIYPFSLDDFVGALNCSVVNSLLDSVHVTLMRVLKSHFERLSADDSELALKCLRFFCFLPFAYKTHTKAHNSPNIYRKVKKTLLKKSKVMTIMEPNSEQVLQEGNDSAKAPPPTDLDAGAQFVLKSRGSWIHAGYHLTTSIVAPTLLSLPFAFASLGWTIGVISLVVGALVTFYSYNLLSKVLEHHAQLGRRHLRFRDMANDILGPRWGKYYVGPIQFLVCYGAVVGSILLGGQCMKAIYLLTSPNEEMKLYQFVIIFGGLMLILAQIPSFHSLRHINLVSLVLSLAYSACATAGSIYIGSSSNAPVKDYSLSNNDQTRVFGLFNSLAIVATTLGNGIIPEIQATLLPPVTGKMFKGLCICYAVITVTFSCVAVSGYWAFGNAANGLIYNNFLDDGRPLLPEWFILMTNSFTILQLSAVAVVYLQPTNEVLERTFADPKSKEFSARNVIPRVISRSLSVVIATTIAAMLPFFGDINALIGAFGFMPLDFALPVIFFNVTFKPSKRSFIFWFNTTIAVVFSVLGAIAAIAAVRQIILDARTYRLFANV